MPHRMPTTEESCKPKLSRYKVRVIWMIIVIAGSYIMHHYLKIRVFTFTRLVPGQLLFETVMHIIVMGINSVYCSVITNCIIEVEDVHILAPSPV